MVDAPNTDAARDGWRATFFFHLFFYLLFFLYIFLYLDPRLLHCSIMSYWRLPPYVPGSGGFEQIPGFPGKTAMCAAGVLLYCFHYSWAGALIITAVAWLLSWGTGQCLDVMSDGRLRALRFIPAIVVLLQYSRYYHFMMENLSIALGLLLFYLYTRACIRRGALRFILFLFFSAVIYYAAVFAYLPFVMLCALYELLVKRAWLVDLGALISAALIPIVVSALLFDISAAEVYLCILPNDPAVLPYDPLSVYFNGPVLYYFLYVFFPIAGLASVYWRYNSDKLQNRFRRVDADKGKARKKKSRKSKDDKIQQSKADTSQNANPSHGMLSAIILLIILICVVLLSTNHQERHYLRIRFYSQQRMWNEVLYEARNLGTKYFNVCYCHDVNRALYHSGRLLDEMFAYPQPIDWCLYHVEAASRSLSAMERRARFLDLSETYYELGRVNEAENFAWDALAGLKYHPQALKRLALINIVKRQPETARALLRILREDFLYRDQAQELLDRLEEDPDFSSDEEIQRIRSLIPDDDSINEGSLTELLAQNKHNRMAFEYLMASYFQRREVLEIVNNIERLRDFQYATLPRAFEEALVIYMQTTGQRPDLYGYEISPESITRLQELINILNKHNDKQAALTELADKFGDTYYFYNVYGFSGSQLIR
ncbi:US12 family protein [Candidatus Sumerlaeota bacterium]|nr:US12 family protein [Candidatus Sumerlaeota bacterium]